MPAPLTTPSLAFRGLADEALLRGMADLVPHALFTTDTQGRITFWNRAAERITGWSREEAAGRGCSILAGDAVNGCACGVGPLRCGLVYRQSSTKTCTLRAKDGRLVLIVKSAVPLLAPDGTPLGALETFAEVRPAGPERRIAARVPIDPGVGLVGDHPAMADLRRTIALVAATGATVLVLGESGSGKNRVAEAIHAASSRAEGPLVRLGCASFDDERIAAADHGTLLLDEVSDLSEAAQTRLLRFVEDRTLGEPARVPVDVRIVCTTNRDLERLVAAGRFRSDLFFRLSAFPLRVPPLRDHVEDLPAIAHAFLARRAPTSTGRRRIVTPDALAALAASPWPGNVRELENVL
ncbi:MAG TPA: sigma 54-interacting transcriptional regulator, partial [Anaeromyxobacteraceae bacterium]|nr:sigma 54-interacting transcriptional regulator [Anaeromyxobacteraceae bacterium]